MLIARLRSVYRNLFHRAQADADLDEELRAYVDALAAEHRGRGLSYEDAYRAARLELRGSDHVKDSVRDVWMGHAVAAVWRDLVYSARGLRQRPGFTLLAIGTLAVGLGSAIGTFSVAYAVMFRPPPGINDPSQVVAIDRVVLGQSWDGFSYPAFQALRDGTHAFKAIAAHVGGPTPFRAAHSAPENVIVDWTTGNYFRVLGVRAALGRLLGSSDAELHDAKSVLVLSHRFWQTRFGGDSSAIGQVVELGGTPFTIVGVAAQDFDGTMTGQHVEAWAPLPLIAASGVAERDWATDRRLPILSVVARLAPGVSASGAQRRFPGDSIAVLSAFGRYPDLQRQDARLFLLVGAAVALLLLLACANVATLCLLRAASRRHELAARLALGASRLTLARQLLLEGSIIAATSGALGGWAAELLVHHVSAIFLHWGQVDFGIDARVMLFAGAAVMVTMALVSIAPVLVIGRADPMQLLRAATAGGGRPVSSTQRVLVAAQVALSLVLVATATTIVRSIRHDLHENVGFDPRHLSLLYFEPRRAGYTTEQYHQVVARIAAEAVSTPGVASATLADGAPLLGRGGAWPVFRDGQAPAPTADGTAGGAHGIPAHVEAVAPGYFSTLRISMQRGRGFRDGDRAGAPAVAVVSAELSRRLWGHGDAIGRYVQLSQRRGPPLRLLVVGVAGDVRYSTLTDAVQPLIYLPLYQRPTDATLLIVRGPAADPAPALLKRILERAAPDLHADGAWTSTELMVNSLRPQRVVSTWIGVAGIAALLLAALGVYGTVGYAVRMRARELAVRSALGATPRRLVVQAMREGLRLAALGAVVGTGLLFWTQALVRRSLDGISGVDPVAVAVCVALLAAVMAVAGFVPARRVTRISPSEVLREE